ncbi:MAG TPA: 6-carboxytetrahydropterin synthase [Anaerohalosphaeraceae bacterium]|jgi:6-pyruvoyltetrahydropterin/6-carboxytetrahydropterin synthase|nr:6-carboxytetrahydropterin synthase [Anaerohalosphaeraceae bacterium]HRT51205.1 6-carboxytetrahydropterin synthase [Anaerohalosphaeraceae bacterium]HRT87467.1 6-carboxytetrahydropterin synthase [Anaerohalosphaeraceae bacterium]
MIVTAGGRRGPGEYLYWESVLFTVIVEGGFTASHALLTAGGQREPRHTHEWKVRVAVAAETLDEHGLAVDFVEISRHIADITGPLQNAELEAVPCFAGKNASAERVAVCIYEQMAARLAGRARLEYVEIMEAPGCWVRYRP